MNPKFFFDLKLKFYANICSGVLINVPDLLDEKSLNHKFKEVFSKTILRISVDSAVSSFSYGREKKIIEDKSKNSNYDKNQKSHNDKKNTNKKQKKGSKINEVVVFIKLVSAPFH